MTDAAALFRFLLARRARGEDAALVTLVGVVRSAARSPGTQMAVGADGAVLGSFTAGCADAAVVAEAREAMRAGRARTVRFGAGSPFMDIQLPCGGGIELLVTPRPPAAALERARALIERRRAVALRLGRDGGMSVAEAGAHERTGWDGDAFLCRYEPPLRLLVAGHGAEPAALLRLAAGFGAEATLLSPDPDCVAEARALGMEAERLTPGFDAERISCDAHTAVVLLFHDHDWEARILRRAIEGGACFIGAMGSRRTHAARCRKLEELGVPAEDIARVVGPVGLIEAARDPQTLAVSILAQVVGERARAARERADEPGAGTASGVPAPSSPGETMIGMPPNAVGERYRQAGGAAGLAELACSAR